MLSTAMLGNVGPYWARRRLFGAMLSTAMLGNVGPYWARRWFLGAMLSATSSRTRDHFLLSLPNHQQSPADKNRYTIISKMIFVCFFASQGIMTHQFHIVKWVNLQHKSSHDKTGQVNIVGNPNLGCYRTSLVFLFFAFIENHMWLYFMLAQRQPSYKQ